MARKLVVVALGGFAVAIVSALIAISLGGPGRVFPGREFSGRGFHLGNFINRCDDGGTQTTSRHMPWTDNSGNVEINLAGDVNWTAGAGGDLVISGPQSEVDQVRIDGDQINAECTPHDSHDLVITLPGRAFTHYAINGLSRVRLSGLNQPAIDLVINGFSQLDAAGVVPQTNVDVSGAASLNLSNLITQNLRADLSGASNLTANPAQSADINLSGAGSVNLLTRPRNYHANISGLGHVDVPDQPASYE